MPLPTGPPMPTVKLRALVVARERRVTLVKQARVIVVLVRVWKSDLMHWRSISTHEDRGHAASAALIVSAYD